MKQILIYILVLFSIHCYGQQQMFLRATAAAGASGILDGYTGAGFAGAIDVLLYSSHSEVDNIAGSATNGDTGQWTVTIRRDNDNAVRSFTATEVGDGTLTTWVGGTNNGYLRRWWDQSGNGNHADETDITNQVSLVNSGILATLNSKAAFDVQTKATGRYIEVPDLNATDATLFSVYSVEEKSTNPSRTLTYGWWRGGASSNSRKWVSSLRHDADTLNTAPFINTVQEEEYVNGANKATVPSFQVQLLHSLRFSGMVASDAVKTSIGGIMKSNDLDIEVLDNYTGYWQVLVIYTSNQSANIPAIESIINTEYSIYP